MPKNSSFVVRVFSALFQSKLLAGIVILLTVVGGAYLIWVPKAPSYQFIAVSRGAITETVSATGNTKPIRDVSLGFENSGTIARVYTRVGERVAAGQLLAELNMSDLSAQLRQVRAAVSVEKAKLEGLLAGALPEDIAASTAALEKAKQDLANMNASISDIAIDAQAKASDAVRTQLSSLFSNAETQSPKLTFDTLNSQRAAAIEGERIAASVALNSWQNELQGVHASSARNSILLEHSLAYLATIRNLLSSVSSAVDGAINLSGATLSTNKTNVVTAQNEVNTATKNLNTIAQSIASQKLTVAQLEAQLALKKAVGSVQDVDAQKAQVEKAEANVASIEAKIQNSRITAPISGMITQFDAKVGQLASPSIPLISVIGTGGFEVEANISETDIGKVAESDQVSMTFDAFSSETFLGTVFYIAPAETNLQGVVNYQVKVSFVKPDARLKSGLTANLTIATDHKDDVLLLPQYALLENDKGTFVKIQKGMLVEEIPVTLGLQDQDGMVEITSGVAEGTQVIILGLKKQ